MRWDWQGRKEEKKRKTNVERRSFVWIALPRLLAVIFSEQKSLQLLTRPHFLCRGGEPQYGRWSCKSGCRNTPRVYANVLDTYTPNSAQSKIRLLLTSKIPLIDKSYLYLSRDSAIQARNHYIQLMQTNSSPHGRAQSCSNTIHFIGCTTIPWKLCERIVAWGRVSVKWYVISDPDWNFSWAEFLETQ